jgi:hypothetical protein
VLVVPAAGAANGAPLRAAVRDLAAKVGDRPPALAIWRTDLDQRLGLAALHYKREAVAVYCNQDHMPLPEAEEALASILGSTRDALVAAAEGSHPVRVIFQLHGEFPRALRYSPPLFLDDDGTATVQAWSGLVTKELAGVLGCLWTGMIGYLARPYGEAADEELSLLHAGFSA